MGKNTDGHDTRRGASYTCEVTENESQGSERTLVHIPVIHTRADMGALGASIGSAKLSALGRQRAARSAAAVERMWVEIAQVIRNLQVIPGQMRVYQDGLPVCGYEQQIVADLAEAGSQNHKLLLSLQSRGATLMGTESPELLIKEYQLANEALAHGRSTAARMHWEGLRHTLLEQRDRFIAERINGTLRASESGILFIGMLHKVTGYLDPDISVIHPLGRPARGKEGVHEFGSG